MDFPAGFKRFLGNPDFLGFVFQKFYLLPILQAEALSAPANVRVLQVASVTAKPGDASPAEAQKRQQETPAVIRSFSAEAPQQTLSEVAARSGLTRAGARAGDVLSNEVEAGYMTREEADALLAMADALGDAFDQAVEWVLGCKGRVVCCGVGKSGHIARKTSGTLSSTGTARSTVATNSRSRFSSGGPSMAATTVS